MVSVIEVYNAVRDIANKDQKGFVTPRVFNSFASIAQQSVFNGIFAGLAPAHALRNRGGDAAGGDSALRGIKDDVSIYVTEAILSGSSERSLNSDNNLFSKPDDFFKLISLRVNDEERTSVALVYDPEKIGYIMGSHLSAPVEQFPVALMADSIELFPSDIDSVIMTYYRQPSSVTYAGVLSKANLPKITVDEEDSSGFFSIDATNTYNFDLPEQYKDQVINEIAKLVGLRLRDAQLLGAQG